MAIPAAADESITEPSKLSLKQLEGGGCQLTAIEVQDLQQVIEEIVKEKSIVVRVVRQAL